MLIDAESARVLRIISLQYNPDTLTRSLQIKGGESADRSEAMRLTDHRWRRTISISREE
jgi:hypothetical protein